MLSKALRIQTGDLLFKLLSHTRASLRVGLTAAQLRQLAQVLREHGDNDAATRADEALQKALENK